MKNVSKLILILSIYLLTGNDIKAQNVGIGNVNPSEKLVVDGNILIPGSQSIFIGGRTDLGQAGSRFHHSNGNTYFDNKGTGHIFFRGDNTLGATNRAVILNNGNMGIADINPAQRLSVDGNISLTGSIITDNPISADLQNNWQNGSPGGGRPAMYLKDKQGFVHIWGVVNNEFGGSNNIIFTLPAGYRPNGTILLNQPGSTQNTIVRVEIRSNGEVRIVGSGIFWVSLDNIIFRP